MYQRCTMAKASRPGAIAITYMAAIVGHSHCPNPAFADAVLFALTRPRNQRILETVFRPMIEPSWG